MNKRITLLSASMLLTVATAFAQTNVTGTVVSDDDGEPVIGATIRVQGNSSATVTDTDGKFTIAVPTGKKITISYIGMDTQTVAPKSGMIIRLHSGQELQEIVVTGMQKTDRRLFTGATTKVDAEKARLNGVADISRSLEGRAAGVSVQNVSGTFGTAPKIRVRGATSIYGSSRPLWVVDGVIMEDVTNVDADQLSSGDAETLISSAIAGLNADDIESFQILKDGSATSIYGARAMAGVIVVTTKKGKAGQTRVNYTGEFTMRLKPSYSNFNIMNSQEQMGIYKEMEANGLLGFSRTYRAASSGVYGRMYQLLNTYNNQAELKYKPISKVELSVLGAYKFSTTTQANEIRENSNMALSFRAMDDATIRDNNPWLYRDPDQPNSLPVSVLPSGGFYRETKYKMQSYDFRATASYNDVYNDRHLLNLYGGMEINDTKRSSYFNGVGMQYDMGYLGAYNYLYFKQAAEQNNIYYNLSNTYGRLYYTCAPDRADAPNTFIRPCWTATRHSATNVQLSYLHLP